jgi:hypothetical protein
MKKVVKTKPTRITTKIKSGVSTKTKTLLLVSMLLVASMGMMAAVSIGNRKKTAVPVAKNMEKISFKFAVPKISIKATERNKVSFDEIILDSTDYGLAENIGSPAAPFLTKLVALPGNAENIKVKVNKKTQGEVLKNVNLAPIPRYVEEGDCDNPGGKCLRSWSYAKDNSIYNKDTNYPKNIVDIDRSGFFRNQQLALVKISPYQYNPVKKTLEVIDNLDIELTYTINVKKQKKPAKLGMSASSLKQLVANPEEISNTVVKAAALTETAGQASSSVTYFQNVNELLAGADIDYLIITHDDFIDYPVQGELYDLASYRANYDGYHVGIVSLTDINTATFDNPSHPGELTYRIQKFVRHAFDNWATAPEFLLLLGDVEWIPTITVFQRDPWYASVATVEGPYGFSDMAVGRLSVRTKEHIANISAKIQEYEQGELTEADNLVVSKLSVDAPTDISIIPLDRLQDRGYDTIFTSVSVHEPEKFLENFSSTLLAFQGHGDPYGWYACDADNHNWCTDFGSHSMADPAVEDLYNNDQTPFVVAMSCSTGNFSASPEIVPSINEALLRMTDKGAVGYYGFPTEEMAANLSINNFVNALQESIFYQAGTVDRYVRMTSWSSATLLSDPALHLMGHRIVTGLPELAVGKIGFDFSSQQITVETANFGSVPVNNVMIKLYDLGSGSTPILRGQKIISLAENSETITSFNVTPDFSYNWENYKAVINPINEPGYTYVEESFLRNNSSIGNVRVQPLTVQSVVTYMRGDQPAEDYSFGIVAEDENGYTIYQTTEVLGNGQIALNTIAGARFTVTLSDYLEGVYATVRSNEVVAPVMLTLNQPVLSASHAIYKNASGEIVPARILALVKNATGEWNQVCSVPQETGYCSLEPNLLAKFMVETMGGGPTIESASFLTPADVVICEDVNADGKSDCCIDGTAPNSCSTSQPKYCSGLKLIDDCKRCGCPGRFVCRTNSSGSQCVEQKIPSLAPINEP